MRSRSKRIPSDRRAILALPLCLALAGAGAAACCVAQGEPPDLEQAERDLANARDELEKIVGPRLLGLAPPPIPEVPEHELSRAEQALVDRLYDAAPGDWSPGDRALLEELLARALPALAAVGSRGEVVTTEELLVRAPPLLRTTRLLSLRDRLLLLGGRTVEALDGLERRTEVALRLTLQPNLVGPLLGTAVERRVLDDVRCAVLLPETSRADLERLDALLLRWRLDAPDAAAAIAREALTSLDGATGEVARRELAAEDPADTLFAAPWAEAMAELARGCRGGDCREAVAALQDRARKDDDPYDVIATIMIPNLLDATKRFADAHALGRLAHVAVALRLEALEQGSYPASVEPIAARLGLTPEQTAALTYEVGPHGEARLGLVSDRIVADAHALRRDLLLRLSAWDLPAPPAERR